MVLRSPLPVQCESIQRRQFLKELTAAAATTLGMGAPHLLSAGEPVVHPESTADSCILIWLAGGMGGSRHV